MMSVFLLSRSKGDGRGIGPIAAVVNRNYYNFHMPKSVDIYVLESKIGCGQFGDVFRGYSKVDGIDVAIKTIRRDKIKGNDPYIQENSQNF
jgi:serine/threonine protein kinase